MCTYFVITPKILESFGWILQKSKFICDMGIVENYLTKWGNKQIPATQLPNSKKYERGERNYAMDGVRRNLNFSNLITEISVQILKLPRWSARMRSGKSNCGKASCWNCRGGERKLNGNCGNEVAGNGEKKIVAIKVPKL